MPPPGTTAPGAYTAYGAARDVGWPTVRRHRPPLASPDVDLLLCCALLGAALGAYTPRIAHRLSVDAGRPPRAGCAACATPFPPGLPGWVRAGRACPCPPSPSVSPPVGGLPGASPSSTRVCPPQPGASPGPAVWGCVLAGAAAAAALGGAVGPGLDLIAFLAAAALGVLLAAVDLACRRLPDPLVGALLAVVVTVLPAAAALTGDPDRLGRAAVGGAVCLALHLAPALLPRAPVGMGDAKLAGVLGVLLGWLGWPALGLGLALPHLLNGPVAVWLLVTRRAGRRTALPFGPALLAGGLLAALLA